MKSIVLKNSFFLLASLIIVFLVLILLSSYTRFIFAKEFLFHIETQCDTSSEICFIRNCDEYCPPNGLEEYSLIQINASLFEKCSDNSCTNLCSNSSNNCLKIACSEEYGDICSSIK